MIVIDSSAIIAIFRQEEDSEDYARSIATDDDPIMLAKAMDASLLCKGNDFPLTDVRIV